MVVKMAEDKTGTLVMACRRGIGGKNMKKERMIGIISGIALCFILGLCTRLDVRAKNVANPKEITSDSCIGHRGARDKAPQNTLASFQEAVKAGYTMIECDLWYTLSGDILICHLESIEPYTGAKKKIWELTLKNRKKYRIRHGRKVKKYPNMYFMSANEVMKFAADNNVKLFLHLKSGGTTFSEKAMRKLNRIIRYHNPSQKPVLVSSNKQVIRRMKKYRWKKAFLCPSKKRKDQRAAIDFASSQGCSYLIAHYRKKHRPTWRLIHYGHKKGLKMVYLDVKTRKAARYIFRKGGDFCITDKILFMK